LGVGVFEYEAGLRGPAPLWASQTTDPSLIVSSSISVQVGSDESDVPAVIHTYANCWSGFAVEV